MQGDNLYEMSKPILGKNKKNIISLSSAELAPRAVKVRYLCLKWLKKMTNIISCLE